MSLATETIWKAVYTSFMKGYSLGHFLVPDQVKNAKRTGFLQFNSIHTTKPEYLDDWTKSWKQRAVFVNHVFKIHSEVVSTLQQKSNIFTPKDTPLHDARAINKMESHVGSPLPIDFALFMLHFAHCLTLDYEPEPPLTSLASGRLFEDEDVWKAVTDEIQFTTGINEGYLNVRDTWIMSMDSPNVEVAELNDVTIDFLHKAKFVCISHPLEAEDSGLGEDYLTVLIQRATVAEGQVPEMINNGSLDVDCEAIRLGLGKIFMISERWGSSRQIYYVELHGLFDPVCCPHSHKRSHPRKR